LPPTLNCISSHIYVMDFFLSFYTHTKRAPSSTKPSVVALQDSQLLQYFLESGSLSDLGKISPHCVLVASLKMRTVATCPLAETLQTGSILSEIIW
jgi:hypothetical protein